MDNDLNWTHRYYSVKQNNEMLEAVKVGKECVMSVSCYLCNRVIYTKRDDVFKCDDVGKVCLPPPEDVGECKQCGKVCELMQDICEPCYREWLL